MAALHANHRLLVLTHGQLLQVVVRLEQHLANVRPCQPCRLEPLHLHRILGIKRVAASIDWVEGEERLPVFAPAHLERSREVLQVHGCSWLHGRGKAHGVGLIVKHQAAHTLRRVARRSCCSVSIAGDVLSLPSDIELLAASLLDLSLLLLPLLLLLLQVQQHELRGAFAMHKTACRVSSRVGNLADGETAVGAQDVLRVRGLLGGQVFCGL
mmetsp:Transcript_728/g.2431  ORF Transcript_728/g.2431 Transcript_728/m.2431 type:complete len:212 (-) Transcript_728:572-1207(-)